MDIMFIVIGCLGCMAFISLWVWLINRPDPVRTCTTGGTEHAFQPRYNIESGLPSLEGMSDAFKSMTINAASPENLSNKKTYVHDICIRCGKIVKSGS